MVRSTIVTGVAAASALAVFSIMVLARPLDADATALAVNLSCMLIAFTAAGASAHAARRTHGRPRIAWSFIALSLVSWGLGQTAWAIQEEILGLGAVFPSWADAGYLLFIPLAITGLAFFFPASASFRMRLRTSVDGLIIAGSLFILSWHASLDALVSEGAGIDLTFVTALAYPVGDVMLATWVFTLMPTVGRSKRWLWLLLGLGMLAFAVSDTAFLYLATKGAYETGTWVDIGWIAGLLTITMAAVVSSKKHADDPAVLDELPTTASLLLPYIPFAIALAFLAFHSTRIGHVADRIDLWALGALSALVLLRQTLTLIDNARLARRLASSNARLSASEAARVRLLNTITHDLLNPLTPVRLQLHLLKNTKPALDTDQKRSVEVIERNIDQLQRLVTDVKDLARLEGGSLPLVMAEIDVGQIAEQTVETFRPLAAERGLTLRADVGTKIVVNADRGRVTQVVFNLVSNALKFTPRGGDVVVGVTLDADACRLDVHDTGRGLTQDEIGRLFKPFVQVHAPGESPEKGTGLGLFLSRAIAEQHGGTLSVESPGLRQGSTFHLRLPRAG